MGRRGAPTISQTSLKILDRVGNGDGRPTRSKVCLKLASEHMMCLFSVPTGSQSVALEGGSQRVKK